MKIQIKNERLRDTLSILSLGYMGGIMYCLIYLRYVFYDQMMVAMSCTNEQLGFLNTTNATISLFVGIIGAYLADKWDSKKIILVAGTGITVLTFVYAVFNTSYPIAVGIWACAAVVIAPYWAALNKYINNMKGPDKAGNSFGTYYLINGLAGAAGNAIPLAVSRIAGFRGALIALGVITLLAVIMIALFLDSEKDKLARGEKMVGDEPIRLKDVKSVLTYPGVYILFFSIFGIFTLYTNVSYFNPYLINVMGIDPDASSAISVIRSYGSMLVAPVGGFLADRVFKGTSRWFTVGAIISGLLFAVTFVITPDVPATVICIYSLLPSLVTYAMYSIVYSVVRELHIPVMVQGTTIGLAALAINVANMVEPTLFGKWLDSYGLDGYKYIFAFLIGTCVFVVIIARWAIIHDKRCREGKIVFKGHENQ